jgi:metal-responsive CopG/Arc/MetJ family transcriptional regulator
MGTVRLNITLPEDLLPDLEKVVKTKKKSQFIAETLRQRLEKIRHEKIQKALAEGYSLMKNESRFLSKEFESIDIEGWDEY